MKILILCSGGDAPGMNRFVYDIYSVFKKDVYFAYAGFSGLIDNQIFPICDVAYKGMKFDAGTIIKSSRCPEFKQKKYFKIALENAKQFDVVIILGGNGSECGAKELSENGVNCIFVPATIDNDVKNSSYSIGFFTAVNECVYAIVNSMKSIESMNNACFFEVMGRDDSSIAKLTAQRVGADYCIMEKEDLDFEKIKDIILSKHIKNQSAKIVVRENIMNINEIANKTNDLLGINLAKVHVVGRTQRGGRPTKAELQMADKFAKEAVFCIKKKVFNVRILANEKLNIFIDEFI